MQIALASSFPLHFKRWLIMHDLFVWIDSAVWLYDYCLLVYIEFKLYRRLTQSKMTCNAIEHPIQYWKKKEREITVCTSLSRQCLEGAITVKRAQVFVWDLCASPSVICSRLHTGTQCALKRVPGKFSSSGSQHWMLPFDLYVLPMVQYCSGICRPSCATLLQGGSKCQDTEGMEL